MGRSSVQVTLDRYGHLFPELDEAIAEGLDRTYRASLRLIRGGRDDTGVTQMTRAGHEIGASGGRSRAPTDTTKTGSEQAEPLEGCSVILLPGATRGS
jgi:hypothetical protein